MFELTELLAFLREEGLVEGIDIPRNLTIHGFSTISSSVEGTLSWSREKNIDWSRVRSSVVISSMEVEKPTVSEVVIIPVDNPRLVFMKTVERFHPIRREQGIEDTAIIGNRCSIAESAYIGHYVVIGDNVSIYENTHVHSHVTIYDNVEIGSGCRINSGTVIGADGFGYERVDGYPVKFPHIGGVIIEDDVEIGSNTSIDRGTLGNTIVRKNAKIDNLCHIAHNVVIGEGSFIIACSIIGGSTTIGKGAWIAPKAAIKEGLTIGNGATVGMGAVVLVDVEPGDVVAGIPARPIRKTRKTL